MRYDATQTLRVLGGTPFRRSLIEDTALYFVKDSTHSSTYIIGLSVGKCFDEESGFWHLLEKWVAQKFAIPEKEAFLTIFDSNIHENSLCNFGIALNITFTHGCYIPKYDLVLGGTDGISDYSEAIADYQPASEAEEQLIQEYIDKINLALRQGGTTIIGKIPA